MKVVIKWLIYTLAVAMTAFILPGVNVAGFWVALLAAVILVTFNTFLKPVLIFLTLPITILSLGFFVLVINALLVLGVRSEEHTSELQSH